MHDELVSLDVRVLVIGGGGRTRTSLAARMLNVPFPILADPHRHVYRAYGFERIIYLIQRSGTVVIDRAGIVRHVRGGANPYGALDPEELRSVIRGLSGA
jgi:peroxiredoxin